jgi:hypothetical protein
MKPRRTERMMHLPAPPTGTTFLAGTPSADISATRTVVLLEPTSSSRTKDVRAGRRRFLDEFDGYHSLRNDIFESTLCIGDR